MKRIKITDKEEEEYETTFGVLVPWGGGGPGVDWDKMVRQPKEKEAEDGNNSR